MGYQWINQVGSIFSLDFSSSFTIFLELLQETQISYYNGAFIEIFYVGIERKTIHGIYVKQLEEASDFLDQLWATKKETNEC